MMISFARWCACAAALAAVGCGPAVPATQQKSVKVSSETKDETGKVITRKEHDKQYADKSSQEAQKKAMGEGYTKDR